MKQNITTFKTSLLLAGSLALAASCQDYEPFSEQQVQDRAYTREFERQFGEIDPNQDWDLFGQLARGVGPMTRATAENAEIKITDHDRDANYAIEITQTQHSNYTTVLPEIDVANTQYGNSNLGRVTQDFVSTSRKFSLAPVHWNTNATDAIGIYWYVDDESAADEAKMGRDGKLYYIKKVTIFEAAKCNLYMVNSNTGAIEALSCKDVAAVWGWDVPASKLITYPKEVTVPNSIASYGFWIKNGTAATKYSEKNLNEIVTVNGFDEANGKTSSYIATFNIKDQIDENSDDDNNYLCFEDWYTTGDWDLNDIVYWAEGLDESTIVETNTVNEKAILVCEDLAKFDWDFNDIALGLNYKEKTEKNYDLVGGVYQVTGSSEVKKLTVTAMAAGGAYESNIYLAGSESPWGEIHTLLNESTRYPNDMDDVSADNHHIINAGPEYEGDGQSQEFDFADYEDWNVGTEAGQYATHLSQLFQTGYFKIVSTDGNAEIIGTSTSTYTYNDDKETNTAPQMMLLPWYFEWPQEQIHIKAAYTGFADWVQDYTQTTWIVDSQVPANITDRGDFVVEEDSGSGSSSSETGQTSETFTLDVTTPASFSYTDDNGTTTTYTNVVYIDLTGYSNLATTDATGELTIVYTYKPTGKIYLNDANGVELITDEFGSNAAVTTTYTLSNSRLLRALQSGGIYIVEKNNSQISVSSATLKISGVTENRHNLTVPETMTFSETATQQIAASSSTDATLTYKSFDKSIVTVDANGVVTPVKNGTTKIMVTAAASGDFTANVAYVTVTVNVAHTLELSETSVTMADTSDPITVTATTTTGATITTATSSDAIATATYENGVITIAPVAAGTATITVTAADSEGNFTTTEKTITVTVTSTSEATLTLGEVNTETITYEWSVSWGTSSAPCYSVDASSTEADAVNIANWNNGATLTFATSAGIALDLRDVNNNSVLSTGWSSNDNSGRCSYSYTTGLMSVTLTADELAAFVDGSKYTIKFVYSNSATISNVVLTKKN